MGATMGDLKEKSPESMGTKAKNERSLQRSDDFNVSFFFCGLGKLTDGQMYI
jgi:hypothetical protein